MLVALGLVYFSSALLSAGPMTPLTLAHGSRAAAVLGPYFQQNWQLFAPDPISEERGIVARVRCSDGEVTPFEDVTTQHIEAIHSTRFFPSRKSRLVSNGLMQVFLQDPYLVRFRARVEEKPVERADGRILEGEDVPLSKEERDVRAKGERVLVRFAAWSLADRCADRVQDVQLRYMLHKFPRWSQRERWQDNGEISILESSWFAL